MASILKFSFQKNPLRMTALHRPRYYYGELSMHKQKRNKLLSAKTHSAPEYIWGPRRGDIFCPRVYFGEGGGGVGRLKG